MLEVDIEDIYNNSIIINLDGFDKILNKRLFDKFAYLSINLPYEYCSKTKFISIN